MPPARHDNSNVFSHPALPPCNALSEFRRHENESVSDSATNDAAEKRNTRARGCQLVANCNRRNAVTDYATHAIRSRIDPQSVAGQGLPEAVRICRDSTRAASDQRAGPAGVSGIVDILNPLRSCCCFPPELLTPVERCYDERSPASFLGFTGLRSSAAPKPTAKTR
jgi:hypothetical protein